MLDAVVRKPAAVTTTTTMAMAAATAARSRGGGGGARGLGQSMSSSLPPPALDVAGANGLLWTGRCRALPGEKGNTPGAAWRGVHMLVPAKTRLDGDGDGDCDGDGDGDGDGDSVCDGDGDSDDDDGHSGGDRDDGDDNGDGDVSDEDAAVAALRRRLRRWPPCAVDLLLQCVQPNPARRITAAAALAHPFFKLQVLPAPPSPPPRLAAAPPSKGVLAPLPLARTAPVPASANVDAVDDVTAGEADPTLLDGSPSPLSTSATRAARKSKKQQAPKKKKQRRK
jgi:hypothetical protein